MRNSATLRYGYQRVVAAHVQALWEGTSKRGGELSRGIAAAAVQRSRKGALVDQGRPQECSNRSYGRR
jgi:hypothetical protein